MIDIEKLSCKCNNGYAPPLIEDIRKISYCYLNTRVKDTSEWSNEDWFNYRIFEAIKEVCDDFDPEEF
jgi:hypothetical protein